MASLQKALGKQFIDSVLPTFGTQRKAFPTYDASQRAWICNQYESEKGHRYWKAVRFSDNVAIVESDSIAYGWTFINSVEIYAFNGRKFELIQKKDFDQTTYKGNVNEKAEIKRMLMDYLKSITKISGVNIPEEELSENSEKIVEQSYKNFLDEDYNIRLTQILPLLEQR